MTFSAMKVSSRLALGFGGLLFLLTIALGAAIVELSNLNDAAQVLAQNRLVKVNICNAWIGQLLRSTKHTSDILLISDQGEIQKELAAIADEKKLRKQYMDEMQASIKLREGIALLQKVVEARDHYAPLESQFFELVKSGDTAAAKDLMLQKMRAEQAADVEALQHLVDFEMAAAVKDGETAAAQYQSGRNLMIALEVASLLLGVAGAMLIAKSLLRQLGGEPTAAAAVADRIARGDLAVAIDIARGDTSSLMHSMKTMRNNLREIVGEVRNGATSLATATDEIARGNLDLSSRTESQAASLEETASSMEELTSTVQQTTGNAREANQLSLSASAVAQQGGDVVAQVVATMDGINASAKRIVDIIGVIDGIAFQTNILALNAAVEAARAGEQGRGFAVVAAEVRNLAQRSASAAKEIKELIGDSVEKVDAGSRLVNAAGMTMADVVDSVQRVTTIIGQISAASEEQFSGITLVNQAVSQMDENTQQNAALVEEAAAAAGSLQEQAANLLKAVSTFVLDDGPRVGQPVARVATSPVRAVAHQAAPKRVEARVAARSPAPVRKAPARPQLAVVGGEWEEF